MLSQLNEIAQHYEYLVKAVGAFLPLITTILMAYIAYQQWQTNERKRKQNLFDKRWDLYKKIRSKFLVFVILCFRSNPSKEKYYFENIFYNEPIPNDYTEEFLKQTHKNYIFEEFKEEVYFLFGEDVYYRLKCLQSKEMFDLYKGFSFGDYFDMYFKDVFSKYLCIEPNKFVLLKQSPEQFSEYHKKQRDKEFYNIFIEGEKRRINYDKKKKRYNAK